MNALAHSEELCPNCGEFVPTLDDETGFCASCSPNGSVGVLHQKTPTLDKSSRLELWLQRNADIIEDLMLESQVSAKLAIKEIAENTVARCLCCGNRMPHATPGRHQICTKQPQCKKASRYYKYLKYEKGFSKEEALERALEKYKQQ